MANLNFPPATPGVPGPEYTLNGIVYYWDGEKWTANNEDGFTEVFVNVDGDNMTGDLTLGTDKITLDATDGTATFAGGDIEFYTDGSATYKSAIIVNRDTDDDNPAFLARRNSNTNAVINTDGSATFAGGKAVISADGTTTLLPSGSITDGSRYTVLSGEGTGAGGVTDVMAGSYNSGSNWLWNVRRDGSASFAGSLSANQGKVVTYTYNSGLYLDVRQLGWVGVNVLTNGEGKENACIKLSNGTPGSSFLIAGYGQGNSEVYSVTNQGTVGTRNVLFQLEPDNDANYVTTTDVDEEGNTVETRVYNGPTLDVKAVIQELQQRVADRDAVIADVTARLAALEADHATLMSNNGGSY